MNNSRYVDPEIFQMFFKDDRARDTVRHLLQCGSMTLKNFPLAYESLTFEEKEKDKILSSLQKRGILISEYNDMQKRTTYRFPLTYHFQIDGASVITNPDIISEISDAIVYSQAGKDAAQILHYCEGKVVKINGMEGLLKLEDGELYHITKAHDQAPLISGGRTLKTMIRKTSIPIQSLTGINDDLSIGHEQVVYSCFHPHQTEFAYLSKLLADAGVKEVYGNFAHELM